MMKNKIQGVYIVCTNPPKGTKASRNEPKRPHRLSIFFPNKSRFYPISIRFLSPGTQYPSRAKHTQIIPTSILSRWSGLGLRVFISLSLSLFDQPVPCIRLRRWRWPPRPPSSFGPFSDFPVLDEWWRGKGSNFLFDPLHTAHGLPTSISKEGAKEKRSFPSSSTSIFPLIISMSEGKRLQLFDGTSSDSEWSIHCCGLQRKASSSNESSFWGVLWSSSLMGVNSREMVPIRLRKIQCEIRFLWKVVGVYVFFFTAVLRFQYQRSRAIGV